MCIVNWFCTEMFLSLTGRKRTNKKRERKKNGNSDDGFDKRHENNTTYTSNEIEREEKRAVNIHDSLHDLIQL